MKKQLDQAEKELFAQAITAAVREAMRLARRHVESPWVNDKVAAALSGRSLDEFREDYEDLVAKGFPRRNPLFGNMFYKPSIISFIERTEGIMASLTDDRDTPLPMDF